MAESTLVQVHSSHPPLVLTLASERRALEDARLAVNQFITVHALPPKALFHLELILEETLMNIVWHAFSDGAPHAIEVMVSITPDDVALRFDDAGAPFDPLQAEPPSRPATLNDAKVGGLGLMLVRELARSVAYERRDGRNLLDISVARH